MAREIKEVRIDGELYMIGQWPVDKSLSVLTWLTKTLGETFAGLSGLAGDSEELLDKDLSEVIGPAIRSLGPQLSEKEVQQKCRDIVDGVLHEGRKIVYDIHFMGRIGHLFKVITEVLKVQYDDFFDALSANVPPAEAERMQAMTQVK